MRENGLKMFDLYEVFEDMEVPDTACDDVKGAMRTPRKLHKIFFHNQTSVSTLKNMAYGRQFLDSRTTKLTFVESKRCQFLFILSMGQDGVFKKTLTSP